MVAITLTAIVLGIAAGALSAATTARDRVASHQRTLDADTRFRAMLTDMLRHAPNANASDEALLQISRDARDEPTLTFLTNGVTEPFGVGRAWRVTVAHHDSVLTLDAVPLGRAPFPSAQHTTVPAVRVFDVRVLEPARMGEQAQWRTDWPVPRSRPRIVELRIGETTPTLRVALSPLEDGR